MTFLEISFFVTGSDSGTLLEVDLFRGGFQSSVMLSQNSILISGDSIVTLLGESFRLVFKGLLTDLRFTGDFTSDSCFVCFCLCWQFFS